MRLEEALKQNKKFKTPLERALVNVQYTFTKLSAGNADAMNEYDISIQQYNILRILRGRLPETATVKYLIERMIDKSSNASRLVDKLVAKGYVRREQCPGDRRAVDVIISDQGMKVLSDLDDKMKKDMKNNFGHMSVKELDLLNDLLDKLREGVE